MYGRDAITYPNWSRLLLIHEVNTVFIFIFVAAVTLLWAGTKMRFRSVGVLYKWVEKIEWFANRFTGQSVNLLTKSNLLAKNPNLLVNGSTVG